MIRLIINADDFGLTDGVSAGILQCLRRGGITSTSALVCDPAARRRLLRWRDAVRGRAGVHLQLTDGRPLNDPAMVPSLVNGDGFFPRYPDAIGDLDPADIRREWQAQMAAFSATGLAPAHIDTHHHVHSNPAVFEVYCEIAAAHGLPARSLNVEMTRELRARRLPCADLSAGWTGSSRESLLALVRHLRSVCSAGATAEIVCHPGRVDAALERASVYVSERAAELAVLCAPGFRRMLAAEGIALGANSSAPSRSVLRSSLR